MKLDLKPNLGWLDRFVRALAGLVLVAIWGMGVIAGVWGTVSAAIGVILLATAATGY